MPLRHLKIAIVLPVFNHGKTVEAVIGDVIEAFPNEWLVVVNDGSGDGTATAIADAHARQPSARIAVSLTEVPQVTEPKNQPSCQKCRRARHQPAGQTADQ